MTLSTLKFGIGGTVADNGQTGCIASTVLMHVVVLRRILRFRPFGVGFISKVLGALALDLALFVYLDPKNKQNNDLYGYHVGFRAIILHTFGA